jgi:hypothetical protein
LSVLAQKKTPAMDAATRWSDEDDERHRMRILDLVSMP